MEREAKPWVSLRGVEVRRGGVRLLESVDWTIGVGEQWVVMGPNGSGKTSLLRVLTGYLMPSAGEVETLAGRGWDEEGWMDLRRQIGWVSASMAQRIEEDQTALEVVASGEDGVCNPWKLRAAQVRRADEQLRRVGAEGLRDRKWVEFSQGERQRLLIARALMSGLKLLVLDEPCAGLDPVAREHFLGFVDGLTRQPGGPGIILVTHHVEEVTPGFTHVLMLRGGRVVASGPRKTTLTSANLEKTFGAPVRLVASGGRLRLEVAAAGGMF